MASSTIGTMITNKPLQDRANAVPTTFTDPFEPSRSARSARSAKADTQHKRDQSYDGSAAEAHVDGVNVQKLPIASKSTRFRDLHEDCISPRTSTCVQVNNLDGWFSFSDGKEQRNSCDSDVCETCRYNEENKRKHPQTSAKPEKKEVETEAPTKSENTTSDLEKTWTAKTDSEKKHPESAIPAVAPATKLPDVEGSTNKLGEDVQAGAKKLGEDMQAGAKKLGEDVQAGAKKLGEDVQAGTKRLGDEILTSTRAFRAKIRAALLTTPVLAIILGHTLAKQVRPAIEHLAEVASKTPSAV